MIKLTNNCELNGRLNRGINKQAVLNNKELKKEKIESICRAHRKELQLHMYMYIYVLDSVKQIIMNTNKMPQHKYNTSHNETWKAK